MDTLPTAPHSQPFLNDDNSMTTERKTFVVRWLILHFIIYFLQTMNARFVLFALIPVSLLEAAHGFVPLGSSSYLASLSNRQGDALPYAGTPTLEEERYVENNFVKQEKFVHEEHGGERRLDKTAEEINQDSYANHRYYEYDDNFPPVEEGDYLYWVPPTDDISGPIENDYGNEYEATNYDDFDGDDDDAPRSCLERGQDNDDDDFLMWMVEYMYEQEQEDKDYNLLQDQAFWDAVAEKIVEETEKAQGDPQYEIFQDSNDIYHSSLLNVLDTSLRPCGPLLQADGSCNYCNLGDTDEALTVCCQLSEEFLESPHGEYCKRGNLQEGDVGCISANVWLSAYDDGVAPPVFLESTNILTLKEFSLDFLRAYALDHGDAMDRLEELQSQRRKLNKIFESSTD